MTDTTNRLAFVNTSDDLFSFDVRPWAIVEILHADAKRARLRLLSTWSTNGVIARAETARIQRMMLHPVRLVHYDCLRGCVFAFATEPERLYFQWFPNPSPTSGTRGTVMILHRFPPVAPFMTSGTTL